ncbi:tRNA (N(6)-L-threonylcarbamoyladenosine(37)-C(2))-methylthiotransferase MtaB [Flavobacteriales bacterium]|nr:tRNA (N(6)-L-threonylcarbamoyladenosine(37)-C(2))-methylthiotransferase MtaB [Flavobacteriales bacterium]
MNVAFKTLGCKLNYSETSSISRDFENKGHKKVSFKHNADLYVINTCSVTQNADKEFKYLVNKAKKQNPKSKIIAIGCYAQLKPNEISKIEGVDLVLGANKKFDILNYIDVNDTYSCEINSVSKFESAFSLGDRTRSFLKVQDGCDYKCTYCTIPLARGKSRSGEIIEIVDNAKKLVDNGVKEIVLTGVNIGDYGFSSKDQVRQSTFLDLIKNIEMVTGLERVRISSIEPNLLSDEIIHFVSESKKFMPHFHIPLQSGSNKILKLMKRRYLKNLYLKRVEKIKTLIPDCCIGADIIVGFPSEDEKDFLETYTFLEKLDISYLHVFPFSERDNTEAKALNDKNSTQIKNERSYLLRKLSDLKKDKFYKKNIFSNRKVLFESENKNGFVHGFTDNYVRVKTLWSSKLVDKVININLYDIDDDKIILGKTV